MITYTSTYTYHWDSAEWKIDDNGMVAQSMDEIENGSLPIFTELAREINRAVRAKQEQAGLPVTPKWPPAC